MGEQRVGVSTKVKWFVAKEQWCAVTSHPTQYKHHAVREKAILKMYFCIFLYFPRHSLWRKF